MSEISEQRLKMQVDVRGEAAPLVLVGGGLTGMLSFEPHQARLAHERRVVRAQLLSVQYGLEDRPLPLRYSLRMESEALSNALEALDLTTPFDVVAWSYGAAISLDYALNHPERIRTLTLIEPPAFWVLDATGRTDAKSVEQKKEMATLNAKMRQDIGQAELADFLRQAGMCPPDRAPQSMPQWPVWYEHRRSLRANAAPLDHTDSAARLTAFEPPVLLVKGTGSAHFLHAIIDALAATIPNGRVIELPSGHAPHLVAMDRFLSEVTSFQRSQESR